nr:tetratricopeptide repeat protein [Myxococcota bacterium]
MSACLSLLAALATAACSVAGEAPREATAIAPEPGPVVRMAERALAYSPGADPTDRRIARAQDEARRAPAAAEPLVALATLFLRRYRETAEPEHLRRAEDAVGAALDREPDHDLALALSGFLAMQGHRFREARATAERILRRQDDDTTALLLLGDAHLELGAYDEALDAYQRATDLRPDLRTYNRGAYLRWLHGDSQGSLELLQLAIGARSASDPESAAWCWVDLANVHLHLGNRAQARVAIDRALALVADYLPALRARARLEVLDGDRAAAIATMDRVIARAEGVGDLLFSAELLDLEGRADESQARVARARQLRREDPRAWIVWRARRGVDDAGALRD